MTDEKTNDSAETAVDKKPDPKPAKKIAKEINGRKDGLDPTRYGDWEKAGRAIDF